MNSGFQRLPSLPPRPPERPGGLTPSHPAGRPFPGCREQVSPAPAPPSSPGGSSEGLSLLPAFHLPRSPPPLLPASRAKTPGGPPHLSGFQAPGLPVQTWGTVGPSRRRVRKQAPQRAGRCSPRLLPAPATGLISTSMCRGFPAFAVLFVINHRVVLLLLGNVTLLAWPPCRDVSSLESVT